MKSIITLDIHLSQSLRIRSQGTLSLIVCLQTIRYRSLKLKMHAHPRTTPDESPVNSSVVEATPQEDASAVLGRQRGPADHVVTKSCVMKPTITLPISSVITTWSQVTSPLSQTHLLPNYWLLILRVDTWTNAGTIPDESPVSSSVVEGTPDEDDATLLGRQHWPADHIVTKPCV
jgi:hypothetical protein